MCSLSVPPMADNFCLIYFTSPLPDSGIAARRIESVLLSGVFDYAHIRVPGAPADLIRSIVQAVDPKLRNRLVLHDHFEIALEEALGGVHLNSRNPNPPQGWNGRVSCSCHSLREVAEALKNCEYVTLSPIYPSISKPGYSADFSHINISQPGIIALGGVTERTLPDVRRKGFCGAAILGWLDVDDELCFRRLRLLRMLARDEFRLQYITNGISPEEVIQEVSDVLKGGCRWVQIRMKDAPEEIVKETLNAAVELCKKYNAVCLVDDHVELAALTDATGVHLGKNDMSPAHARQILKPHQIIGSTANSLTDIETIVSSGVSDYIGLGPYRFTTTKRKLAPVLGQEGYREIFSNPVARVLPTVAIGGIEAKYIENIICTGVSGVAVSGAIYRADDRVRVVKDILSRLAIAKEKFKM